MALSCCPGQALEQVVVKPSRPGPVVEVPLTAMDSLFAIFPLAGSGFPIYSFFFQTAPATSSLVASLSELLSTWRPFAGRLRQRETLILNDAGVPFTLRAASAAFEAALEAAAGQPSDEMAWRSGDFRLGASVAAGCEPLLTVTLTKFKSGAGLLALARSHTVADGSSFLEFVQDWAKVIAGQTNLAPVQLDRSVYDFQGTFEDALSEASADLGRPAGVRSMLKHHALVTAISLWNRSELLRLRCFSVLDCRPHVFFSHDELERLKASASASLTGRVPWVTTQEALIAHLMMVLPSFFKSGSRVGVLLWLDGKRFLGPAGKRLCSGTAMIPYDMTFDTAGKAIGSLAEEVQLKLKAFQGERAVRGVKLSQAVFRWRIDAPFGPPNMYKLVDCDHLILLNNQSKAPLVNFGTGPASWVASSTGPSVVLPHQDGVNIFFDTQTLPVKSGDQMAAVAAALHGEK